MEKRIVLLPGWGAGGDKLVSLATKLKHRGWQTLIIDLPGFTAPAPAAVWGVDHYADYVQAKIRKHWPKGAIVFGHSFGGRVAIKLAARHTPGLAGLVLCAPGGLSRPLAFKRWGWAALAKVGKFLGLYRWRKLLYRVVGEHDYERSTGVMREVFKKVVGEDLRTQLEKITVPTLILWGQQDRVVPIRDGQSAQARIKNSQLVVFDHAGHTLPYVFPDLVAERINRWNRLLP